MSGRARFPGRSQSPKETAALISCRATLVGLKFAHASRPVEGAWRATSMASVKKSWVVARSPFLLAAVTPRSNSRPTAACQMPGRALVVGTGELVGGAADHVHGLGGVFSARGRGRELRTLAARTMGSPTGSASAMARPAASQALP
ncbi:hypothetical protein ACRAWF_44930 [Streptomyces sp. L7]